MIRIPNLQIPDRDTTQYYEGGAFSINAHAFDPSNSNGLHRYISSIDSDAVTEDFDVVLPVHLFSTDQFRMFEFKPYKVRNCQRGRSHDWTECPYAHPGEKARRRDPQKYHYSGTPCPEFRREGICSKGDSCNFSHGVFECWLHPSRYRTQLCKDGTSCRRRVCFFAHTNDQLRHITHAASPESLVSSPTSVLNSPLSDSPTGNSRYGVVSVREIVGSMRNVQLEDGYSGSTRASQMGRVFGSPRGGFLNLLPSTPEEEPVMERVESGRDLRAKIYARLSNEKSQNAAFSAPVPDIGWVSELVM